MKNIEFENFNKTIRELMKVPHSEIKAKLDEEKAAKKRKRKIRKRKKNKKLIKQPSSASREAV